MQAQHSTGAGREAGLKQEGVAAWPPASATLPLARCSSLEAGLFCHPAPGLLLFPVRRSLLPPSPWPAAHP